MKLSWLDWRAFTASALAVAGTYLNDLKTDPLAFAFAVVFGGLFWGAIITWAMKRWPKL